MIVTGDSVFDIMLTTQPFILKLIDCDDLKRFGDIREVGTPGWNCNLLKLKNN